MPCCVHSALDRDVHVPLHVIVGSPWELKARAPFGQLVLRGLDMFQNLRRSTDKRA